MKKKKLSDFFILDKNQKININRLKKEKERIENIINCELDNFNEKYKDNWHLLIVDKRNTYPKVKLRLIINNDSIKL